jgi:ubiquinone/menaquinone biosynthesis C-methylase UbiE
MSAIEILRQLECSMADLAQPYDELAPHYDQIFEDWEASIARQSTVFAGILDREFGDRRPIRVLDCACGTGTQSLSRETGRAVWGGGEARSTAEAG